MFTANLFLAQFLVGVGMILWNFVVRQDNFIGQVLSFSLLYGSLYSTYIWAGLIALSLVQEKRCEELKMLPGIFVIIGWGVPALATALLLLTGEKMPETIDSAFFYGRLQIICTAFLLSLSIVLAGGSLMLLSRGSWASSIYQVVERDSTLGITQDLRPHNGTDSQTLFEPATATRIINPDCHLCDCAPPQPMPDMIISTNINNGPTTLTGQCANSCESTECLLVSEEQQRLVTDRQVARHVLLCLLLTVGLLANLSSCLWWLFNRVPGKLYLMLQFFCAVANYGQGFISFGIFGLDKHLILVPFKKRISSLCSKTQPEEQLQPSVSEDIMMTCSQFTTYHKEQCVQDVVKKRRCGERTEVETFLGSELVDWLLQVGLVHDRGEGQLYGSQLVQGGVLLHINQEYGFQDDSLYYRFTS